MSPKLFAFTVAGYRSAKCSITLKSIVGYVFERTHERAVEYAVLRWRMVYPRLRHRLVNIIEIPTTELPATRHFDALVPARSIPGLQVRALIGWPVKQEAA